MSIPTLQSRHCFGLQWVFLPCSQDTVLGYREYFSPAVKTLFWLQSIPVPLSRHCLGYREYSSPAVKTLFWLQRVFHAQARVSLLTQNWPRRILLGISFTYTDLHPHSPAKIMSFPKTIYVRWCPSVITHLKRSNPRRPMRASATIRTMYVWVVGTSPVQSNLCTPQLALSTAVGNKVTKTESREATVETTQQQRQSVQLWELAAPPPSSDRFWALIHWHLLLYCCFTSTETVQTSGPAHDVHLDFHTARELWFTGI